MDKKMVMLDGLVVKQAVRDIASKKPDLSDNNYKNKLRQGLNNLDKWFYKSNKHYRKKK